MSSGRLNDLAKLEIERLQSRGIDVSPDDIVAINELANRVRTPETRKLLSRGRPVSLGGHWLWPLTLYAYEWLRINNVSLKTPSAMIAYAMAYGRSDGDELNCSGLEAMDIVSKWVKTLRVTRDELTLAVLQVDGQEPLPETPPDNTGKAMSLGDMSSMLSINCGGSPEFWERRCSLSYAVGTLTTYIVQNHADKRPSMHDPRIVAERALGYYIEKIISRSKKANKSDG